MRNLGDMMRGIFAALVALTMTACTSDAPDTGGASPDPSPKGVITLEPGAIRVVDAAGRNVRVIPFGTDGTAAVQAVASAMGVPGREEKNEECGGGGMTWQRWRNSGDPPHLQRGSDIYVSREDGSFIGWEVSAPGLQANGVGVGTNRADLERIARIRMVEDGFEHEFSFGDESENGIRGIFDGAGPDARITRLSSGYICSFH